MTNLQQQEEITDLRSIWKNEATGFTLWLVEDENASIAKFAFDDFFGRTKC